MPVLKVVHIVRQFSPSVGGLESAVLSLARSQIEQLGLHAHVVTLDRQFGKPGRLPATDDVAGIPVTRLPWRGSSRYPLVPSVLGHLRDADIVHVHAIDFFFDFLALTWIFHGSTMIASTHGGFFHTARFNILKQVWFRTLTRLAALAYRQIVACSDSDRVLFQPICGRRLTLIENGIDRSKFAGASADQPTRTIIYFGRLTTHKRVQALFPILAALRALHPSWRLIIAGRETDQTIADLTDTARGCDVADAVTFVPDPSDQQLREFIGLASFFSSLSSYEGFGLAAVEAMSAGLLPVLSDIAPFRRLHEFIPDILILAHDQAKAAAQSLEAIMLADDGYAARRQRIMTAAHRYDWTHVARQYAAVYDEGLRRPPHAVTAELESRV